MLKSLTYTTKSRDHLEPPLFPIQKGSLSLLRQKWESSDHPRSESCPGGSHSRLLQPLENKLLEPDLEVHSAPEAPHPPSLPCSKGQMLNAEPENKSPEDKNDHSRECSQPEVLKEDSLTGRRRIERISIALDELRSVFEAPKFGHRTARPPEYSQKEVETERSLCSPVLKSHPRSQSEESVKDSNKKGEKTSLDKMSPESAQSDTFEG
ncbi:PREDICTED: uncharacterized protein LOC106149549 [Chinchilla lanigera]|uniref:uncharacterized protein LOC106149549 n=1 Tax=Chinchilla lanigera TaxID=34839 RepID=UPI0006991BEB|nr:PREDICTED: uncharacterized protein LOC106149549 [Chinchilla lanigera]